MCLCLLYLFVVSYVSFRFLDKHMWQCQCFWETHIWFKMCWFFIRFVCFDLFLLLFWNTNLCFYLVLIYFVYEVFEYKQQNINTQYTNTNNNKCRAVPALNFKGPRSISNSDEIQIWRRHLKALVSQIPIQPWPFHLVNVWWLKHRKLCSGYASRIVPQIYSKWAPKADARRECFAPCVSPSQTKIQREQETTQIRRTTTTTNPKHKQKQGCRVMRF